MQFDTPVKYVLTEKALVTAPDGNCKMCEPGEEISYFGLPSANMLPLDEEGVRRRQASVTYNKTGRFVNPPPIEHLGAEAAEAAARARALFDQVNARRVAEGKAPLTLEEDIAPAPAAPTAAQVPSGAAPGVGAVAAGFAAGQPTPAGVFDLA